MSEKQVEFFFDVISPASYLAWTQLPGLVRDTGAAIVFRPMFLPGLFKEAGSSSPITVPNKSKWLFHDLRRFAKRYGVKFWMNEHFPFNSVYVMRGLEAYRQSPRFMALADGFMQAMWAENRNLSDDATIAEIVRSAGIDLDEYQARIADPAIKKALMDTATEAAARGAFGAPTFFIGKEMHWGQDRLEFVREALMVS
ncbi:MAG: 2-hydroxychromene-2-carboxylate isomerase [Rhizobiaceae bacterium]